MTLTENQKPKKMMQIITIWYKGDVRAQGAVSWNSFLNDGEILGE